MEINKVEGLLHWIGLSCGNKGFNMNGDKYELLWYINEEADALYDGIRDERLPLYTTNEMIQKYLNKK